MKCTPKSGIRFPIYVILAGHAFHSDDIHLTPIGVAFFLDAVRPLLEAVSSCIRGCTCVVMRACHGNVSGRGCRPNHWRFFLVRSDAGGAFARML